MTIATLRRGAIRKLFVSDLPLLREHLLRLDPETRRSRFVGSVDDSYLAAHAERCLTTGSIVVGYIADGAVRGVAELQCYEADGEAQAEAAFSVEAEYRRQGVADALFQRLMTVARNRGVRKLTINCLANNSAMQALAAKYHAELSFDEGDSIGNIAAGRPTLCSLVDEAVEDARGFARAAILLQRRILGSPAHRLIRSAGNVLVPAGTPLRRKAMRTFAMRTFDGLAPDPIPAERIGRQRDQKFDRDGAMAEQPLAP